jgi:AcrR family transcriptional regulator
MRYMEAVTQRPLAGDKAVRIVEAMRASVAERGAAGSTFDHVARDAGVSRGLLHYYFGSKERLLVEVVRRDTEIRLQALDAALAGVRTADDFIEIMVRSLEDVVQYDPGYFTLVFELFTLGRRNPEIASQMAELMRRSRDLVAERLAAKHAEGVLDLAESPDAVATILMSMADGFALWKLGEPNHELAATMRAGVLCSRRLLGA